MLTFYASDYPELVDLVTLRAAFVNAGCHYDLAGMSEAERAAEVARLTAMLEQAIGELCG
jgi:hypothetical protein